MIPIPIPLIMKYLGIIFALFAALYAINWMANTVDCIIENGIDNQECFKYFILQSPSVKPVADVAEACEKSDEECLKEIGKQAVTSKIQESVKNYPKDSNERK